MSAKLAARLRLGRAVIADAVNQGFYTTKSWSEYDRLLAFHDRSIARGGSGVPFDIEGPEAPDDDPQPDPGPPIEARSDRTERRYRGERKGEINALLARDGRTSVNSAVKKVTSRKSPDWRRWLKVCDECAQPFEAKRADARYCSDTCRKRAARGAVVEQLSLFGDPEDSG